jgi:hypothetical protein
LRLGGALVAGDGGLCRKDCARRAAQRIRMLAARPLPRTEAERTVKQTRLRAAV